MSLWRPRSLIARIFLAETLTILLAGLLLWHIAGSLLHSAVQHYLASTLDAQALEIAGGLRPDSSGTLSVDLPATLKPIYETGYDGRAFVILNDRGDRLAASRFSQPAFWRTAPRLMERTLFRRGRTVGASIPIRRGERDLWIIVSLNQSGPGVIVDDVAHSFLLRFTAILLGLLLLLPVINSFIVRRLVNAVRRVSLRAQEIETRTLNRRLDEANMPLEVAPLVHATNALLERLEASFRLQSEFSANIAHELRTPLATLRAQLDGLADDSLKHRALAQIDRLSHILSQLRDLAALETCSTESFERIDLNALAVGVIAEMAPQIIDKHHEVSLEGDGPVFASGNSVLIGLALTNLIGNALKHTPSGTRITVTAAPPGTLSVRDDGPGVTAVDLDQMTRRFWRADWSRSDGAGLGLSIVQRIMGVHGGRLELEQEMPGACFRLCFPAARPG